MSKKILVSIICLVLAAGLLYLGARSLSEAHKRQDAAGALPDFTYATTTISAPDGAITAQIADTLDKQVQGLSDRTSLGAGQGMIFVFDTPAPQYMWMKDMNFPLDMVWLDQNKEVVYVVSDISPDTYSTTTPKIFYSPRNASYVLEIGSGAAAQYGITQGSKLSFSLTK